MIWEGIEATKFVGTYLLLEAKFGKKREKVSTK